MPGAMRRPAAMNPSPASATRRAAGFSLLAQGRVEWRCTARRVAYVDYCSRRRGLRGPVDRRSTAGVAACLRFVERPTGFVCNLIGQDDEC